MGLLPWEKTTTCPYDPTHQITVSKIQKHLVKCRRNHKDSQHVICPYNASHHIPKAEEQYHLAHCVDRRIVEMGHYSLTLEKPGLHGHLMEIPQPKPRELNTTLFMKEDEEEEDWEREMSGVKLQSYDPQLKCEKSNVLRRLQGATPSERKKFYANEKVRHEQLRTVEANEENSEEEEEEDAKGGFHSPRPSLFSQEPLVRPSTLSRPTAEKVEDRKATLAEGEKGAEMCPRPSSITSRLLNLVPHNRSIRSSSIAKTIREEMAEEDGSVNDTLDSTLGRMALCGGRESKGKAVAAVALGPLRKPKLEKIMK